MGLLELLSKTRRAQARLARAQLEAEEEGLYKVLREVLVFPGSKEEFEQMTGDKFSLIDNGLFDKGLVYIGEHSDDGDMVNLPFSQYSIETRRRLVSAGIVGLIHARPHSAFRIGDDRARYGLPVGKKKNQ